ILENLGIMGHVGKLSSCRDHRPPYSQRYPLLRRPVPKTVTWRYRPMLSHLLRRLGLTTGSPNRRATAGRTRPRPSLERLEGREVPATIYAVAPGNALLQFDSATPGTVLNQTITGLGAGETARGIDFRPRTGQLYVTTVATGMTNSALKTYVLNPKTAAAT